MTGSTDQRLSVAIIARDAATPLRLTLASIREIAEEIIVVDTGSTDRTPDVAREFGARVIPFAWKDDFAAARNAALSTIGGGWTLWLDAGETLSDSDACELKAFVIREASTAHAYLLPVRLPPQDACSSPEQIARPRLLPNHPAIKFSGRVWESPIESLERAGISLVGLPYVIRRGDSEHQPRIKKQRAQRNLRIAEIEIQERGHCSRLWNCIGDALLTLGDHDRAVESFRSAHALAIRGSAESLEAIYGVLTSLGSTVQEREIQLAECIRALEVFPVDSQLLCALGGYMQARGNFELAGQAYLTAYKFGQVTPTVWHLMEIRDVAAVCHSLTLQLREQTEAAVQFLEEALQEHPDSIRIRRRLIELFVQRGEREPALAHAGALPSSFPNADAFRSAVRGACFASQQNLIAAKAYLTAGYEHGCRDPLCLKWLSVCLLSTGEIATARRVLEDWQRVEPRSSDLQKLLSKLPAEPSTDHPPAAAASVSPSFRIDPPTGELSKPAAPITLNLPTWTPQ